MVRTSALTRRGLAKILPAIDMARASWETRIPTAMLNSWLRETAERLPLGSTTQSRPTRVRYMTQADAQPPHFVLFANGTISAPALRALENRLRERFGFEGSPIRFSVRRSGKKVG